MEVDENDASDDDIKTPNKNTSNNQESSVMFKLDISEETKRKLNKDFKKSSTLGG